MSFGNAGTINADVYTKHDNNNGTRTQCTIKLRRAESIQVDVANGLNVLAVLYA